MKKTNRNIHKSPPSFFRNPFGNIRCNTDKFPHNCNNTFRLLQKKIKVFIFFCKIFIFLKKVSMILFFFCKRGNADTGTSTYFSGTKRAFENIDHFSSDAKKITSNSVTKIQIKTNTHDHTQTTSRDRQIP